MKTPNVTHYRVKDRMWRPNRGSILTRRRRRWTLCEKSRLDVDCFDPARGKPVTCAECSVIRDTWLEKGNGKPLTLRRLRAFRREQGFNTAKMPETGRK